LGAVHAVLVDVHAVPMLTQVRSMCRVNVRPLRRSVGVRAIIVIDAMPSTVCRQDQASKHHTHLKITVEPILAAGIYIFCLTNATVSRVNAENGKPSGQPPYSECFSVLLSRCRSLVEHRVHMNLNRHWRRLSSSRLVVRTHKSTQERLSKSQCSHQLTHPPQKKYSNSSHESSNSDACTKRTTHNQSKNACSNPSIGEN